MILTDREAELVKDIINELVNTDITWISITLKSGFSINMNTQPGTSAGFETVILYLNKQPSKTETPI